jgi:hypothetical protein
VVDLQGWVFDIEEVSAGVYEIRGRGSDHRQVVLRGTDPDLLMQECRGRAIEMVNMPVVVPSLQDGRC